MISSLLILNCELLPGYNTVTADICASWGMVGVNNNRCTNGG